MSLRTAIRRAASGCGCGNGSRIATAAIARPTLLSRSRLVAPHIPARTLPFARALNTAAKEVEPEEKATFPRPKRVEWARNPIIEYDEVKALSLRPTDEILLIDVRDENETELGSIPGSVVLPLPRVEEALNIYFNPGNFQNEFAFPKPELDQKIVFFCRTGKRSATACEIADMLGYPNVRNYAGSMVDWAAREDLDPHALGLL